MLIDLHGNGCHALSVVARDHYIRKIQCIHGLVGEDKEHCHAALDSYRLPDAVWVDDTSKWPLVGYLYSSSETVLNNENAGSPI